MNMDLLSSDKDSKSEIFIPAHLNSSKLAQTPSEYQADAISIANNDDEEEEEDMSRSPVVVTEHAKGDS
jgi:hypothetical protein